MLKFTPIAIRPLAVLVALACWSAVATAQVAGIQHPGATKGFDPQPDPPMRAAARSLGGLMQGNWQMLRLGF